MLEFLVGLTVGVALGVLAYMFGHSRATTFWTNMIDVVKRDKVKLEADLSIEQSRVRDLLSKV